MALNNTQLADLRNDILASTDPDVIAALSIRNDTEMARLYNLASTFIVWRTNVSEHEITRNTSSEGTTWSWPALIARSLQEQFVYARMFNTELAINPSLSNVRQGFADIFSGNTNSAPAQRAHLLAISKRPATRAEALFATGTGTNAVPGLLTYEGEVTIEDIGRALNG